MTISVLHHSSILQKCQQKRTATASITLCRNKHSDMIKYRHNFAVWKWHQYPRLIVVMPERLSISSWKMSWITNENILKQSQAERVNDTLTGSPERNNLVLSLTLCYHNRPIFSLPWSMPIHSLDRAAHSLLNELRNKVLGWFLGERDEGLCQGMFCPSIIVNIFEGSLT